MCAESEGMIVGLGLLVSRYARGPDQREIRGVKKPTKKSVEEGRKQQHNGGYIDRLLVPLWI